MKTPLLRARRKPRTRNDFTTAGATGRISGTSDVRRLYVGCTGRDRRQIRVLHLAESDARYPPGRAPFVYRLGLQIFNLARRVRLP